MAANEWLLLHSSAPVLRLYRWARPEITFGYPQRWSEIEPLAAGRPATRRWTGGGLVEHGEDLTISLAIPSTEPIARLRPTESYRLIHTAVRDALLATHPTVRLASADDARPGPACFTAPACLDLLLDDQKILGGAQRRSRYGLLYQGSLQNVSAPPDFAEALATQLADTRQEFIDSPNPDTARYAAESWNRRR